MQGRERKGRAEKIREDKTRDDKRSRACPPPGLVKVLDALARILLLLVPSLAVAKAALLAVVAWPSG